MPHKSYHIRITFPRWMKVFLKRGLSSVSQGCLACRVVMALALHLRPTAGVTDRDLLVSVAFRFPHAFGCHNAVLHPQCSSLHRLPMESVSPVAQAGLELSV